MFSYIRRIMKKLPVTRPRKSRTIFWLFIGIVTLIVQSCGGCGGSGGGKSSSAEPSKLKCLEDNMVLSDKVCDPSKFPRTDTVSFYPIDSKVLDSALAANKYLQDNQCEGEGLTHTIGSDAIQGTIDSLSEYVDRCKNAKAACNSAIKASDNNGCTYNPPNYDTSGVFDKASSSSCVLVSCDTTYTDTNGTWVTIPRKCEPLACQTNRNSCERKHLAVPGCKITIDTTSPLPSWAENANKDCHLSSLASAQQTKINGCNLQGAIKERLYNKIKTTGLQSYPVTINSCEDLKSGLSVGPIPVKAFCSQVTKKYSDISPDVQSKRDTSILECQDTAISIGRQVTAFDSSSATITIVQNLKLTGRITKAVLVDSVPIDMSANFSDLPGGCTEDSLQFFSKTENKLVRAKDHDYEYHCDLWNERSLQNLFREQVSCASAVDPGQLYCGCSVPVEVKNTGSDNPSQTETSGPYCHLVDSWNSSITSLEISEIGASTQDASFGNDAKAYSVECRNYGATKPTDINLASSIDTLKNINLTQSGDSWKSANIILSWNAVDKALAPTQVLRVLPTGKNWSFPSSVQLTTPQGSSPVNVCLSSHTVQLRLHFSRNDGYCGVTNYHTYADSMINYANAVWSQECVKFDAQSTDSAGNVSQEIILSVQCDLRTNPNSDGCAFDKSVNPDGYKFDEYPNIALGGPDYKSLQTAFALNFDNIPSTIEVMILDGTIWNYGRFRSVHSGGIALPRIGKLFDADTSAEYWGALADSIHAPIVFLGCGEKGVHDPLIAAHELGHILTGREHQGDLLSLMHSQDETAGFIPDMSILGITSVPSNLTKYQKSQVRTNLLRFGASGNSEFNNDY